MRYKECDICYQRVAETDFYPLSCCQTNSLCETCFQQLNHPYCPFCRKKLEETPLGCYSKSAPSASSFMESSYQDHSHYYSDDIEIELTRSQRRQWRRQRKLEQREQDQLYNKELSWVLSKSSQQHQVQQTMREDMDSYFLFFDDNQKQWNESN